MSDIDNVTNSPYNYARERSLLAMLVWRYCQENTVPYGTQPTSDNEADDAGVVSTHCRTDRTTSRGLVEGAT